MSRRGRRPKRQRRAERAQRSGEAQGSPGAPAGPAPAAQPQAAEKTAPAASAAKGGKGRAERRARLAARGKGGGGSTLSGAMPWILGGGVIVAGVIVVGVLLSGRGGGSGAAIGQHWHADLAVGVCGEGYVEPEFHSEIHVHAGDPRLHIHPSTAAFAGKNATLGKYFSNTRMKIGKDFIQLPGDPRLRNGDPCPSGKSGQLRVLINDNEVPGFLSYRPKDGDKIAITFE